MNRTFYSILLVVAVVSSCVEYAEEKGLCTTASATATINGSSKCFMDANINFQFENTPNAIGQLTIAHTKESFDENLSVFFKIPQAGITLNTPYDITEGNYAAPEDMPVVSGTVTITVYDQNEISGTFQASAQGQNSTTATLTEGKFTYKL